MKSDFLFFLFVVVGMAFLFFFVAKYEHHREYVGYREWLGWERWNAFVAKMPPEPSMEWQSAHSTLGAIKPIKTACLFNPFQLKITAFLNLHLTLFLAKKREAHETNSAQEHQVWILLRHSRNHRRLCDGVWVAGLVRFGRKAGATTTSHAQDSLHFTASANAKFTDMRKTKKRIRRQMKKSKKPGARSATEWRNAPDYNILLPRPAQCSNCGNIQIFHAKLKKGTRMRGKYVACGRCNKTIFRLIPALSSPALLNILC